MSESEALIFAQRSPTTSGRQSLILSVKKDCLGSYLGSRDLYFNLTSGDPSQSQRIRPSSVQYLEGKGTYTQKGFICSSLAGILVETPIEDGKVSISIKTTLDENLVPSVGSVVSAKVTNVNPRFCKCAILSVGTVPLRETFRGMIRKEDVRATEKDKVDMYKSYRPGDIILAKVLSLGDALSYLLTTAENELGVVTATSEAGVTMVPISWCEMQCPNTLTKEHRKVARVRQEYIEYSDR